MPRAIFATVIAFIGSQSFAADGPAKAAPFTIETQDGIRAGCELHSLDENGISGADGNALFKYERFLELRREGRPLPPILTRDFLLLTTGDRIALDPGASAILDGNRLTVWPVKSSLPDANAAGLNVYVPYLVAAFWSLPEGTDDAELFAARLQVESRKRDVVYLKNGDRIEGSLIALSAKTGSVMNNAGKRVETPWSKISGIAWNTERSVRPRAKKAYARAVLSGGDRISFPELRFDAKTRRFAGKTIIGAALEFPEENLLAIDMHQDLATDLAEMTPAKYEHRPYLGAAWPLARDSAATGHAQRLAGSTYEKGLGMHAPCRASYKIDGKFERFDALVGIDEAARRGRARVALELDGKRIELNDGKELTAKDAPLVVRQDIRGVRELTLIVELGAFGDVQAHVNWAKARLIKLK